MVKKTSGIKKIIPVCMVLAILLFAFIKPGNWPLGFYNLNVYAQDIASNQSRAIADKAAPPKEAYGNIYLADFVDGIKIRWNSGNPDIITDQDNGRYKKGVVTRQDEDTVVRLTASFTTDGKEQTQNYDVTVKAKPPKQEDMEAYLMVTFGQDQFPHQSEKILFLVSEDGLNWDVLNEGNPIFISTLGSRGLRDPQIVRSPEGDRFFMVATDLKSTETGYDTRTGSKSIMVFESADLVNWEPQRMVKVAPDDAGCAWAPESSYDKETGDYLVYWCSTTGWDNFKRQRIYCARTRDFKNFSEPVVYMEKEGYDLIDISILTEGDTYYRFVKDCDPVAIIMEQSKSLSGPFTPVEGYTLATTTGFEGPAAVKVNGEKKWYLYLDRHMENKGYGVYETTDLDGGNFTPVKTAVEDGMTSPVTLRHGGVLPITRAEYERLIERYSPKDVVTDKKELLHYNFTENENGSLKDLSGNDHTGTVKGGAVVKDGMITFDGVDDYVQMPNGILKDCSNATITVNIKPEQEKQNVFAWTFGNSSSDGYIFMNPMNPGGSLRTAVTKSDWSGERGININGLPVNQWSSVTVVWKGANSKIYVDGELKGSADLSILPSELGDTIQNYLAKSQYAGDAYFKGQMRDFRVYNYAFSSEEVRRQSDMHAVENRTDGGMKITAVYDKQGTLKEKKVERFEKGTKIDSPQLNENEEAKIFIWDEKQRPLMDAFVFK